MKHGTGVFKFVGEALAEAELSSKLVEVISKATTQYDRLVIVCMPPPDAGKLLNLAARFGAEGRKPDMEEHLQVFQNLYSNFMQQTGCGNCLGEITPFFSSIRSILDAILIHKHLPQQSKDILYALNGKIANIVLFHLLNQKQLAPRLLEADQYIKTDAQFGKASIDRQQTQLLLQSAFEQAGALFCMAGGMGSTSNGQLTYLGLNGADLTAATIAWTMKADEMVCYTLLDGVMTADPAQVTSAYPIPEISYTELLEMSHLGMRPFYAPALHPAIQHKIPIIFKNLNNDSFQGTRISERTKPSSRKVKGLVSLATISLLHLTGTDLPRIKNVSSRFLGELEKLGISVPFFTKPFSGHSLSAAVRPQQADAAIKAINEEFSEEISRGKVEGVTRRDGLSLLAIVGDGMKDGIGVSGKLFYNLGRNGINVIASAQGATQKNHTVVIEEKDLKKALNVLHEVFFLSDLKSTHVFLVGPGLIGSTLLKQIDQQREFLRKTKNLDVKVIAVANSKKMLFDEQGISAATYEDRLQQSKEATDLIAFVEKMKAMNLPNSVFVDATASDDPITMYGPILESSIAIVTPNKRANSGAYARYVELKQKALSYGAQFRYETNVGAGLPIVNTLKSLIDSGDYIKRIDAILSGTISYIFNTFSKEKSFGDTVLEAKELGYTEPDPREDLNGADMARKILILAREIGYELEPEDIIIQPILPSSCANAASVEEFFRCLKEENDYFERLRTDAEVEGKKLRFIGTVDNGKVEVKLEAVGEEHPFFSMKGSDSIISFITERYKEDNPLLIRGPGAGAEVTSAGVFAEIIDLNR